MKNHHVAIIGAGPAGIGAAVELAHTGLDPLLIEKNEIGGLLHNANSITNFPGIPYGISGVKLIEILNEHLAKKNIQITKVSVERIDYNRQFILETRDTSIHADRVVIATGTKPIISIFGNQDNVFYEVYPIREVRNKTIAIIGAGDAAFDYANTLLAYNKVIVINRSERIKANETLYNEVIKKQNNFTYIKNCEVLHLEKQISGLKLELSNSEFITVDYLLIAMGRIPTMPEFLKRLTIAKEYLQKDKKLLFIGDVKNKNLRQSSISIGEGIRAAMEIMEAYEFII